MKGTLRFGNTLRARPVMLCLILSRHVVEVVLPLLMSKKFVKAKSLHPSELAQEKCSHIMFVPLFVMHNG